MLQYWIWLSTRKSLGAFRKRALLDHFGSPESVYLADNKRFEELDVLRDTDLTSLLDRDLTGVEKILADCDSHGVSILTLQDAKYPERLKTIPDPPLLLYYEGTLPDFGSSAVIAMVGSRTTSVYGQKSAMQLGYQLSAAGAVVISGGARGIDTCALRGALTGGSPVCAVLGCGTDVVYPRENASLFDDIRRHGCLLSEYPPGTQAFAGHFPVRNRLLSGLSLGVVVVEAPKKSGALITAELALEQGRDVFTIPAGLDSETMQGNIQLMKDGAIIVEDVQDILGQYSASYRLNAETARIRKIPEPVSQEPMKEIREPKPEPKKEQEKPAEGSSPKSQPRQKRKEKQKTPSVPKRFDREKEAEAVKIPQPRTEIPVDNEKKGNYIDIGPMLTGLNPYESAILRAVADGPKAADEIIEITQMSASKILSSITMLEIMGYLKHLPGKRFYRSGRR